MKKLIYLADDLESTAKRILSDDELNGLGLNKTKVKQTLTSFQGDEIAASVFLKKYALRDNQNQIIEFTLESAKDRWATVMAEHESKLTNVSFPAHFRELYDYFLPAGRQMYALGNPYIKRGSYTNCYVTEIEDDSIEGIFDTAKKIARTFSYGGGIGFCMGKLRPRMAKVSNTARYSTGSVSFMPLFSLTTEKIGQEGRRAALMLTMPITHPDIEDFIEIKHDNKDSVRFANISVKITDAFMDAVVNDSDFELLFTTPHETIKKIVKAKDLWQKLIKSARDSAEPGLLFWDHITEDSPTDTYDQLKVVCTNPCVTGDTLVYVADGRGHVPIKELAEKDQDIPVFCFDKKHKLAIRMMRNPRITGYNQPIYKITFDDGNFLRVTGNHKLLLKSGDYCEAKDLMVGDSLHIITKYENLIQLISSNIGNKIISIEQDGFETVYNGTVDEFHNFFIGGFEIIVDECIKLFNYFNNKNCGELPLAAGFSCVLGSLLLHKFVKNPFTPEAEFDFDTFGKMTHRAVRHLDNVVELNFGRHPLAEQEQGSELSRRIGLGITGLADMLTMLNIRYDSQEALDITSKVMNTKMVEEYKASIELSKERGAFPLFDSQKHYERGFCLRLPEDIKQLGRQYGQRNAGLSTVAPNGSLSIIAQCSSGIEPIFALGYKRYVELGAERKEFSIRHQGLARWAEVSKSQEIPCCWVTAHEIDHSFRIAMQGVVQLKTDASISSTINCPKDVSVETIGDIYMKAWKAGLKGLTVYREGSREGILITDEFAKQAGAPMDTIIYEARAEAGDKFYIPISYTNRDVRKPYQVFLINYKTAENDRFVKLSNDLIRMLREKDVDPVRIQKYIDRSTTQLTKLTRFISLAMKTGYLEEAVAILDKHGTVGTLAAELYKILNKSADIKKIICQNSACGSSNVRMEEGCMHCLDCGWSGCH